MEIEDDKNTQSECQLPAEIFCLIQKQVNTRQYYTIKYSPDTEIFSPNNNKLGIISHARDNQRFQFTNFVHYSPGFNDMEDPGSKTGFIVHHELVKFLFFDAGSGEAHFDGPNDANTFLLSNPIKNSNGIVGYNIFMAFIKNKDQRKKMHQDCWDRYCDTFDNAIFRCGSLTALALYNKDNIIACADNYDLDKKIALYDSTGILITESVLPKKYGLLKKLSFLTHRTLFGLTQKGRLITVAFHEASGTLTIHKQRIKANNTKVKVQNFAVDPCHLGQLLLLLEDNRLFLVNIKKPAIESFYILNTGPIENLWFYNDKVGYLEKDSIKDNKATFVTFDLYQFVNEHEVNNKHANEYLTKLVEKFIDDDRNRKHN